MFVHLGMSLFLLRLWKILLLEMRFLVHRFLFSALGICHSTFWSTVLRSQLLILLGSLVHESFFALADFKNFLFIFGFEHFYYHVSEYGSLSVMLLVVC